MRLPKELKVHPDYPEMYYLVWSDGVQSKDFYNLTRANEYLVCLPEKNYKFARYAE